ncbi:hypothetical protein BDZ91DRAFT_727578 [Kalaharituber pfeilii]|nr:hypothetical protein BDZ91DRAFT_727578 [Kalaharituber pfeilii]
MTTAAALMLTTCVSTRLIHKAMALSPIRASCFPLSAIKLIFPSTFVISFLHPCARFSGRLDLCIINIRSS